MIIFVLQMHSADLKCRVTRCCRDAFYFTTLSYLCHFN